MHLAFPEKGVGKDRVLAALEDLKLGDADWQHGRVPLFVFKGSDEASEIARAAYNAFFHENALGRTRAFPSIERMEHEIISMALDLFNAPEGATGFVTTGGTESIIQAVQTCRDAARAKRGAPGHRGNIVMAISAHPAFDKAARLMDLEVRRLPVGADLRADTLALENAVDADTIMLVGSAPCFPYGVFDPIGELAQLARSRGLWLHVDACVGGYLAPFVKANGGRVPDFDLAIDGVSSLSADLHKFGYAPKPISTLFYRSNGLARYHGFEFSGWPNGRFVTTTIVGTRAGGAIAGAWALFKGLGRSGYCTIAESLMEGVATYRAGISALSGFSVLGDPELSIVAFAAEDMDIFEVAEVMKDKGWVAGLLQEPKAIHRMMSMLHVPMMDAYLADLRSAVDHVRRRGTGAGGLTAEY